MTNEQTNIMLFPLISMIGQNILIFKLLIQNEFFAECGFTVRLFVNRKHHVRVWGVLLTLHRNLITIILKTAIVYNGCIILKNVCLIRIYTS
jgi:hypothetical protein